MSDMMPGFSVTAVKGVIADTLRLFVGHGRRLSWSDLAEATGDKERKLRSYVEEGGPEMPLDVFMRVFTVLPPEAFARVARFMGFSAAPLDVDDQATVRRALAQSARLVADGNEFLEDGVLSPRERAQLRDRASALLPVLQSIAGNGSTH
ncbi:MAG: hypothetical protein H6916_04045 [Novosphingobium sp.]|uniref:hypothetical protein n=1 Tax=Novosphingobium sp. TaxID=1874826 RepID=UPI002601BB56|nr:hypothetical protein [Novosphingobium sp.]MCP5385973.1 hypothetical protein [Novosphingobium sp.]